MLISQVSVFLQTLEDDSFHLGRQVGVETDWRYWGTIQNGFENYSRALSAKGQRAGGHLVQDRAKREQVGARIEFLGANLFRRHIGYGAHRSAGIGEGLFQGQTVHAGALGLEDLGQSEVENLGVTVRGDDN